MKKIFLGLIILLCIVPFQLCFSKETEGMSSRPNIIFIMVDDLGKELLSLYNAASEIETPNIERLAKEGVVFRNVYATPICTATRAKLISGRYGFSTDILANIFGDAHLHLETEHHPRTRHYMSTRYLPSFALPLQRAGYTTAIVGKWHLGNYHEKSRIFRAFGFEQWMISMQNHSIGAYTDQGFVTTSGFHPEKLADFVINFIAENKGTPFFIYYPMHLVHAPYMATPIRPDVELPIEKLFSMVEYVDFIVGRIMQTLETYGLENRTIIFFTSDNGSVLSHREGLSRKEARKANLLYKSKGTLYEGGINVPLIVSGGTVVKRGPSNALVDFTDILPTLSDFAGISVIRKKSQSEDDYQGIAGEYIEVEERYKGDGYSIMPFLTGQAEDTPRKWIMSTQRYRTVIRDQRFKLWAELEEHKLRGYGFYDLYNDPTEENNLYDSDISIILKARQRLEDILNDIPDSKRVKTLGRRTWQRLEDILNDTADSNRVKTVGRKARQRLEDILNDIADSNHVKTVGRVKRNYGMLAHWPMDRSELLTKPNRLVDIEGGYDAESNTELIFNESGKFAAAIEATLLSVPQSKDLFYNFVVGNNNILEMRLRKSIKPYLSKQIENTHPKVLEFINTIYTWIYSDENFIHGEEKFLSSLTVSAWLQTPKPEQPIYLLQQPYIDDGGYLMSLSITKKPALSLELSSGGKSHQLESSVLDEQLWGKWMHIAATWDGREDCGKAILYVNGKNVGDACLGKPLLADDTDDLLIGGFARESAVNNSTVLIDDIAMWRQPLTAEEIGALYSLGNRFSYNASQVDSLFRAPKGGSPIKVGNRL